LVAGAGNYRRSRFVADRSTSARSPAPSPRLDPLFSLGVYSKAPGPRVAASTPPDVGPAGARVRITGEESRPATYTHTTDALSGIVLGRSAG
jgi:hypothetical protein